MSTATDFTTDFISLELFGKDHWSTLAYIETRLVDHRGFTINPDPRMRTCRRCWRMAQGRNCQISDHPTRLKDGATVPKHCDWDCVQDLVAAGLLATSDIEFEMGANITLTEEGLKCTAAIREHKAGGGSFASFVWEKP